jgi:hypothetical protein
LQQVVANANKNQAALSSSRFANWSPESISNAEMAMYAKAMGITGSPATPLAARVPVTKKKLSSYGR